MRANQRKTCGVFASSARRQSVDEQLVNCDDCDCTDISPQPDPRLISHRLLAMVLVRLVLLCLFVCRIQSQDLIPMQLFHAVGEGECTDDLSVAKSSTHDFPSGHMHTDEFTPRGRLVVNMREAVSNEPVILTDDEVIHLKEAANDTNRLYYVKAVTNAGSALAFTRACAIVESSFTNILNIYFDIKGQFIGIGVTSTNPTCAPSVGDSSRRKLILSTTVNVVQTGTGPQPDTQSYIQRMEQDKLEQMKGDRGDNRSFLAKYVSNSFARSYD